MSLYFWETKTLYIPPFLPATVRVLDIHSYEGGTKMISDHFRLLNNICDNMIDQINIKHQIHLLKCNFEVLVFY